MPDWRRDANNRGKRADAARRICAVPRLILKCDMPGAVRTMLKFLITLAFPEELIGGGVSVMSTGLP